MLKQHITLGIDEAGRGPILGPMILAGVWVPRNKEDLLRSWDIKDSKIFGSSKRGKILRYQLARKIEKEFSYSTISLSSATIDIYVKDGKLNKLEQETANKIIKERDADQVVLDGKSLFKPLCNDQIIAENKADQNHLSVAAASILAKSLRDQQFDVLCKVYKNEFGVIKGGGYCNQATLKFVQWHLQRFGKLPEFYRKSYHWKHLIIN
ncbi:MAG: hypothetical protein GY786_13560 [Proteobacteria bacterium]|nr:hypothetical protein [Pseudomonadota bacterium]